jgi:hypothetical protein
MCVKQGGFRMKKILAFTVVLTVSVFNNFLLGMDVGTSLSITVDSGRDTTFREEIKQLPGIVQKDAAEFSDKMGATLTRWSESHNDRSVRSWSVFFRYALFEKEMEFKDKKIKERELVANMFINQKKNKEELDLFSVFFTQTPQKTTSGAEIFYTLINRDKAFKDIRDTNVYCHFVSGFLNMIRGIQGNKEDQLQEGKMLLIASAYGLCNISLEVLKKIAGMNNFVRNIEKHNINLANNIEIKTLRKIIDSNSLFDYDKTLFFYKIDRR